MKDIPLLTAADCYIGQRVFFVMWVDAEEAYSNRVNGKPARGYFVYRPGMSPELWADVVEGLPRNGIIRTKHVGKLRKAYSCALHAVHGEYQWFCDYQLTHRAWLWNRNDFQRPAIEESARVLRLLAELEFGCHNAEAAAQKYAEEINGFSDHTDDL